MAAPGYTKKRFLLHFIPLLAFLLLGFATAWFLAVKKQKSEAQALITEQQDNRSQEIRARIARLNVDLRMIVKQGYFLDDFRSLQASFSRYALERRTKSPLPVLRTLLSQYYKTTFNEHSGSRLAKSRVEDNVNLLSESSLAAQINYLQRARDGEGREFVNDGTRWSEIHARRLADWRLWVDNLAAENLHWVDIDRHDVFFSVSKNLEFTTSLKYGPFAESHLSKFVAQVLASPSTSETLMSDFESELIRWDDTRVYIGLPVEDEGRRIGAFIVEYTPEKIARLFGGERKTEGASSEFLVDASDYSFWIQPEQAIHPARSSTDPDKLQLLSWMDTSRSKLGSDRWVSFTREGNQWWGAVKPLRVFNQDLWIVSEYPKSEFEKPMLFSKAQFEIAFLVGFASVCLLAFLLSRAGAGTPAPKTTASVEPPLPDNVTSIHVLANATPVTRPMDWAPIDLPLDRVNRQMIRDAEGLKTFADLLRKRQKEILILGETCSEMKSKLEHFKQAYQPMLSEVEDTLVPKDNLRFPASWVESIHTSVRKMEILCFGLNLEIRKAGNPPTLNVLLEEFEGLQKKLQRETATVEKWSLQIDDPVQRVPFQGKLVEIAESFKSLESMIVGMLLQISLQADRINGEFANTMKSFNELKQSEGMASVVVSLKAGIETLKAESASGQPATADDIEALFKDIKKIA